MRFRWRQAVSDYALKNQSNLDKHMPEESALRRYVFVFRCLYVFNDLCVLCLLEVRAHAYRTFMLSIWCIYVYTNVHALHTFEYVHMIQCCPWRNTVFNQTLKVSTNFWQTFFWRIRAVGRFSCIYVHIYVCTRHDQTHNVPIHTRTHTHNDKYPCMHIQFRWHVAMSVLSRWWQNPSDSAMKILKILTSICLRDQHCPCPCRGHMHTFTVVFVCMTCILCALMWFFRLRIDMRMERGEYIRTCTHVLECSGKNTYHNIEQI
jgi:hypothetical protein